MSTFEPEVQAIQTELLTMMESLRGDVKDSFMILMRLILFIICSLGKRFVLQNNDYE